MIEGSGDPVLFNDSLTCMVEEIIGLFDPRKINMQWQPKYLIQDHIHSGCGFKNI